MGSLTNFQAKGYEVFAAEKQELLQELRQKIFIKAREMVGHTGNDAAEFFNQFHQYKLSGADLNRIRVGMVDFCTKELNVARTLFQAFNPTLMSLVGPDVAAQKVVNVVIQPPGDADQVPIHRDAPLNSNFEVILWLPLVDVYDTKSMFIADRERSLMGVEMLKQGKSYQEYGKYTESHSENLKISFGSGCFFSAGLSHGCHVNVEKETRWSLNIRYKNLFSPYGSKGLAEFFEIIQTSPLTRVAFEFDRLDYDHRAKN